MSFQVMISQLGSGMMTTIQIFLLTLIFSLPLGLLVAFGRMSKNAVIRTITKIYISIMRGTPLMLQLLVVYFGPYYIFGVNISSELPRICGCDRICNQLCCIFCRDIPWWY